MEDGERQSFGFEGLQVYRNARAFQRDVYTLIGQLPVAEKYCLGQQMRRAAVSLTANIAEGYGRFGWQDRTHFCHNARGSLMELIDGLATCLEQGYARTDHVAQLRQAAAVVLQQLNGYIKYLQTSKQESYEQGRPNA
jgi:four helix bundle protein